MRQIFADGHLCCDRSRLERGIQSRNIAYKGLKERRSRVAVTVSPYGYLDHYVPFYFGTRSPMMFAYRKGKVTGEAERTDTLVYFVATVEEVHRAAIPFAFTDGHPVRMPRFFSNQLADLNRVDLPLMSSVMWSDTDEDPDRMRRRQAEFLVYRQLPLQHVSFIGVKTQPALAGMNDILRDFDYRVPVQVKSAWYY